MKAKGLIGEFKEFALRGNVVDMAVGIVIGVAFAAITNSLVGDIIMPVIGVLTNNYDFLHLAIPLGGDNVLAYGAFIEAVINFIIIAAVLFLVIKLFNNLHRATSKEEEEPPPPTELELLTEIRDLLKK
ncbi:MAG: large-conductance mechanosensitive channel protein MscL [Clostridiales bacterium]|nr:large-conductance mechanosensitive channel protein MscL [Clostridiales bacterium]